MQDESFLISYFIFLCAYRESTVVIIRGQNNGFCLIIEKIMRQSREYNYAIVIGRRDFMPVSQTSKLTTGAKSIGPVHLH